MITLGDALARPVLVGGFMDSGGGTDQWGHFDVFKLWCAHAAVVPKLANYHGFKCDFRVRIEYSPNSLLVGQRVWGINRIPTTMDENDYRHNVRIWRGPLGNFRYNRELLIQRPLHGITEPSGEGILEFVVKYAHNRQFYTKYVTEPDEGAPPFVPPFCLYHDAAVQIYKMDSSAIGTSTLRYNIYVSAENVELFMPTIVQADRENPYRVASSALAKVSGFAKKFGVDTTSVDMARKMGDTVASYFGYSKPMEPVSATMDTRVTGELVSYNGLSANIMVADDANDGFPVRRTDLVCDIEAPDTSIAYIGSVPGYEYMHSTSETPYLTKWLTAAGQGDVLATFVVGVPRYSPSTTTWEVPCPGDYIAQPFKHWRADSVVYTIHVIANPFYRGTLYLEWEPTKTEEGTAPANGATRALEHGFLMTKNVVFSGSTTFEFEVPWMSENQFLPIGQQDDIDSYYIEANLGQVHVMVGAPLRCGLQDSSHVFITTTKHYKNLQLFDYDPVLIAKLCIAPNMDIYAAPQCDADGAFVYKIQSDKVGAFCFGEQLQTIDQIVKIASPQLWRITYDVIAPTDNLDMRVRIPLTPLQPTNFVYPNSSYRLAKLVRYAHPLPYFSSLYLARNGSVKCVGSLTGGIAFGADGAQWVSKPFKAVFTVGPVVASSSALNEDMVFSMRETLKANPSRLVALEYKPKADIYQPGGEFDLDESFSHPHVVEVYTPLSNTANGWITPSYYRVDYSAGESYQLRCFQGVPFGIIGMDANPPDPAPP